MMCVREREKEREKKGGGGRWRWSERKRRERRTKKGIYIYKEVRGEERCGIMCGGED